MKFHPHFTFIQKWTDPKRNRRNVPNSPYVLFLLFLTSKHHHILPPLSSPPPPYLPLAAKLPPTSILCVYIYM
ncbi:hypothetical protein LguiB_005461 [Lonicera macranthoides]